MNIPTLVQDPYNKIDRRGAVYFVQKGYWD